MGNGIQIENGFVTNEVIQKAYSILGSKLIT